MFKSGCIIFVINKTILNFFSFVGATGFEPATPTTPKWCATGLRHAPKDLTKIWYNYKINISGFNKKGSIN